MNKANKDQLKQQQNYNPNQCSSDNQIFQDDEHVQSRQYYCTTCIQKYNKKIWPCNDHKKKQYKCDFINCQKQFAVESGLQRHKVVHTGEKPYGCDTCEQKFNQKSNLNRHLRIHRQQKPFTCSTCGKAFTTTTNLKQHTQIHTQNKQRRKKYICQIKGCNKQYLYRCNLKKHKQQHQDPVSGVINSKAPDFPLFSFMIGNCLFKISHKKQKEHSQALITYKDIANTTKYDISYFQRILQRLTQQQHLNQQQQLTQQVLNILQALLQKSKNVVSVSFEIMQQLIPLLFILYKVLIDLIGENNFKSFNLILPSYEAFKQVVTHVMDKVFSSNGSKN